MAREADIAPSAGAPGRRPAAEAPAVGGGNPLRRFWRFAHESASELRKVEWPGQMRARVTEVDNDALFTNRVTVEPIGNAEQHES